VAAPSDSKPTDLAGHAREQVCSGNDPAAAVGVYSPDFRDYINAREIRIWGIVISRVEDGEIVEDWAASDTLDLVRGEPCCSPSAGFEGRDAPPDRTPRPH
jgi:hypothetical protein